MTLKLPVMIKIFHQIIFHIVFINRSYGQTTTPIKYALQTNINSTQLAGGGFAR